MNKLNRRQRQLVVSRRFDSIDWQLPLTPEALEEVYAQLPKRYADEEMAAWLRRVRQNLSQRFTPTTTIIRRAAASGAVTSAVLYTQDEALRVAIDVQSGQIIVTVTALGLAIDRYAHRRIGITSRQGLEDYIAVIDLNDEGEGTAIFEADDVVRQLFLDPGISPLIGTVD